MNNCVYISLEWALCTHIRSGSMSPCSVATVAQNGQTFRVLHFYNQHCEFNRKI